MKKIFLSLLTLTFAVSFTACGNSESSSTPETAESSVTVLEETVPDEETAPEYSEAEYFHDEEVSISEESEIVLESYNSVLNQLNNGIFNETLQYPSSNEEFEYNVYESFIQITKYTGKRENVVFPEKIDNLPVLIVGSFDSEDESSPIGQNYVIDYSTTAVKSIKLSEGIKAVGFYAFANADTENPTTLETVDIPSSVTMLYGEAFQDCKSIKSVTLPEGIKAIGYSCFFNAFSDDAKISITIPESVDEIVGSAFWSTGISDITFLNKNIALREDVVHEATDTYKATIHGYAGSTAAKLAADTHHNFNIITKE